MRFVKRNKKLLSSLIAFSFAFSSAFPMFLGVGTSHAFAEEATESSGGGDAGTEASSGGDASSGGGSAGTETNKSSGGGLGGFDLKNPNMIGAVFGMMGGIPISSRVSYSWTSTHGYDRVYAVCLPAGEYGKNPSVNEEASYRCAVWVRNGLAIPPVVTLSKTPSKGGAMTIEKGVPYAFKSFDSDGNVIVNYGMATITIKAKAHAGSAALGGSPFDLAGTEKQKHLWGTTTETGDGKRKIDDGDPTGGGGSLCPDMTYNCTPPLDDPTKKLDPLLGKDDPTKQGGTSTGGTDGTDGTDGKGGTSGTDGTGGKDGGSGKDGKSGESGKNGTDSSSGSGGNRVGSLLNDLLNDRNSYNSGDNDWAKSNGGDKSQLDLDKYFGGDGTGDGLPGGLTNDVLGVDDMLNSNGLTPVDTDGDGTPDAYENSEGKILTPDEAMEYVGSPQQDSAILGNGGDDNSTWGDMLGAMGLDGLGSSETNGDGLLGSLTDGTDSLASRIRNIMNSNPVNPNGEVGESGTITEQELFDLAKKMLLANGMSLDDLRRGKNYDPNSAYTEPNAAWDMNRITTLLTNKKIKLESKDDIRKKEDKNTLSNQAGQGGAVKKMNEASQQK